jgi:hypothetical protein
LKLSTIPTSICYGDPADAPPITRFCFAKQHATLEAAAERLLRVADLLAAQR